MSGFSCFAGAREERIIYFTLIGLVAASDFQRCLAMIEYVHKKFPRRFPRPFIRPMLEFDWFEYQAKAQRKFGGILWNLENPLIMFVNDEKLGNSNDLYEFLSEWFLLEINYDFECMALRGVTDIYAKYMELGRNFVYFSISVNDRYIGTLIIMLYCDLAPKTCRNFLNKCQRAKNGYRGTKIHRIMDKSWIQFADFSIPIASTANENYILPHNRRGLVSMCNNGPHVANKTQFFITLDATPWMDYKYVAFGQVMHGEYVLKQLETLSTCYECPTEKVRISNCGKVILEDNPMSKHISKMQKFIENRIMFNIPDVVDLRDVPSVLLGENYRKLKYCYFDDYQSNLPLANIMSSLILSPSAFSYTQAMPEDAAESVENESVHRKPCEIGTAVTFLRSIETSLKITDESYFSDEYLPMSSRDYSRSLVFSKVQKDESVEGSIPKSILTEDYEGHSKKSKTGRVSFSTPNTDVE